ncbi:MAG: hypothetical protein WC943_11145 [Elusimicrobiota bacterium]
MKDSEIEKRFVAVVKDELEKGYNPGDRSSFIPGHATYMVLIKADLLADLFVDGNANPFIKRKTAGKGAIELGVLHDGKGFQYDRLHDDGFIKKNTEALKKLAMELRRVSAGNLAYFEAEWKKLGWDGRE